MNNSDYSLFDSDSGEFIFTFSIDPSFKGLYERPGHVVIDGRYTPEYYLIGGSVSQYTEAQFSAKSSTPKFKAHWSNSEMRWIDDRTQDDIDGQFHADVANALDDVDSLAGTARLRYITSVPGQAETYAKKEEQARAWAAASFVGDPPSFIAAEAAALGVSAQSVADEVISLADFWANVKGPQIEATRRKWKVSIEAATTVPQVDQMVVSAKAELDAL